MELFILAVVLLLATAVTATIRRARRRQRETFIDRYHYPSGIHRKLVERHSHLSSADCELVLRGLSEYFHLCRLAGRRMVSMPSQAVDDAWHEFILFTREYARFCRQALGRFLHHTPAEAMKTPTAAQLGIKRAWRLACLRERIDPRAPTRLPLLFDLDNRLSIANGFHYSLDCQDGRPPSTQGQRYCASHIGCGGGCGGGCAGDASPGTGDGSFGGDGGGDSGGASGGGCGGGGD